MKKYLTHKLLSLTLVLLQVVGGCGRSASSSLKNTGDGREAVFGISVDTGGNVRLGAETRGYTEIVGLGERGSRSVESGSVGVVRNSVNEVLTWVRTVFDTDVPTHSDAAALEQGLPLTMDRVSVGREVPIDLKSATRSGKTEVVEERYESMIAARAAVERQYAANREITAAEKERALQVVQLINHRVDDAARRHNQRVSEVTTDLASLLEALKSIPQASFKTDPANPAGAKLRRLSEYMDERSEELKSNTSLPEATKDDLVSIARTAAALADESYLEGDAATGDQLVEIAYETFEVAIGFTPAGTGVDLYKVAFNRDLLGRELSSTDRVIAIAGVASLGLGGALRSVGKGVALTKRLVKAIRASGRATGAADHLGDVERLAVAAEKIGLKGAGEIREIARELGDAVPTAERLANVLDSAKNAKAVKIPYETGEALQEMTSEALKVRAKVDSGAPLYRVGTRGRSQTGAQAQFWSQENPLAPGYAERYGIPPENLKNMDFLETATLKDGANFITRKAPSYGANPGGAIEVVVPEGGVIIKSHVSL